MGYSSVVVVVCGAMSSLTVVLNRVDRIYRPGDMVEGVVVVDSNSSVSHQGIVLTVEGQVTMQLSAKSVGMFEAFYNSLKPVEMMKLEIEVAKSGKLPKGITELPFEFPLQPSDGMKLFETYHGVFVNIQYTVKADMTRKMLSKNLSHSLEFLCELPGVEVPDPSPIPFKISPDTLGSVKKRDQHAVPKFKISGQLDSGYCAINRPLTGEVIVEESSEPIKSIEIQLVRVETCGCAQGFAKESTEIQNIQIAEGDVCRNLPIPIFMIFPRLFSCPTVAARSFKIEFEVNLVVLLENQSLLTENFPIRLLREANSSGASGSGMGVC